MRRLTKTIVTETRAFLKNNILLVAFFLIALFLRSYDLIGHITFLGDQGRDAIIIKRIAQLQHFPAIGAPTSIGQIYLGPFYYYLVAPFLFLWNFDPVGLAYGVLILTMTGILIGYALVKKEMSKSAALFFIFFVTFSAVNIDLARFSWNPNLLPVFSFLTLAAFWHMLQKKSTHIVAILTGVLFSASLQLHFLAAFLAPAMGIFFLAALLREKHKIKLLLHALSAAIGFAIFSFPLVIYDLRHDFLNTNNFIKLFSQGGVVAGGSYAARLYETINAFVKHVSFPHMPDLVALSVTLLFLLFGMHLVIRKPMSFFSLCCTSVLVFLGGFALLNSPRHAHYFGPAYFPAFAAVGYMLSSIKRPAIFYLLTCIILVLYVYGNAGTFKQIFGKGGYQVEHARRVAAFLEKKIDGKPYNVSTWPVEHSEDPYTYFLELHGLVPADRQKVEITDQMFVICAQEPCVVLNSPSWNTSMFGPAKIVNTWRIDYLHIYKLKHTEKNEKP